MIFASVLLALRSLRRNAFRSFLTTIGIVIGVASVITMVSLARGASAKVENEISSLGNNLLIVVPGGGGRNGPSNAQPFEMSDSRAISEHVRGIAAVAPSAGTSARVVFGPKNWSTGVTGATNDYFQVRSWGVALGREFTEGELRSGATVCILGETVRRELFGTTEGLGERIRVANVSCEVIGVLESRGRSTFGQDQDDFLVMPLVTVQRRLLGTQSIGLIAVSAREGTPTTVVQADIEALMRERRRLRAGEENDFTVRDLQEVTQMVSMVGGVLTALLGAIAAVSLLVGGIGIMNIMLVSVTERTREIGIRLAIGARAREILLQFLIESIVLSLFGGLIGIGLGLSGSALAARVMGIPFTFGTDVVGGAFLFAAIVGVFFGWYPARRASRLDPIEALRHE
jgi:putative ABC transport system permease protein